jgi:hypothetical protein
MQPLLARLGIRREVQEFFSPYYSDDSSGNLVFPYGRRSETYGMAFHHVPATENYWLAGSDLAFAREIFICGSAMEAIAWLHIHYRAYTQTDNLLFLSTGTRPCSEHFRWLKQGIKGKRICLLLGNDLLGRVCDLRTAAALRNQPAAVSLDNKNVFVTFRSKTYSCSRELFSLNAFEKQSAYRFHVRTLKPKTANSWLDLVRCGAFNQ